MKDATADYEKAALATQEKFLKAGVVTKLMEKPDKLLMQSKWIISKED